MVQQAKPRCPGHYRAAVERMVRALLPVYVLLPCSGEIFEGLKACNHRLRGYALAGVFSVVRKEGGTIEERSKRG
jgi:hypothetical protein